MFLRKVVIENFKVLKDINFSFERNLNYKTYPIASINGAGKSTLLQFIFTFLHCSFHKERFQYINNLMENIKEPNENEIYKISEFEVEHENKIINLEFYYCNNKYKNLNFDSIIDLKELKEKKTQNKNFIKDISNLNRLEMDIEEGVISNALIKRKLDRFIGYSGDFRTENILYMYRKARDNKSYLEILSLIKNRFEEQIISNNELNFLIIEAETEKKKLLETLKKDGLKYRFHFEKNQKILLYKSDVNENLLKEISDRVFLATPSTQIFHFLKNEELDVLFTKDEYSYSRYENIINENKDNLKGLFTYEFSVINLILDAFKKARDKDLETFIETGDYGEEIKKTNEELSNLLKGKKISIDKKISNVTIKLKGTDNILTQKDLSHGELRKLSLYIWLKSKTLNNSIILMDEVGTGLHPAWQFEISDELQKWRPDNQYILATHSPQIISKAHYKNIVILNQSENSENHTTSKQFDKTPLERDLNTILKTIMGSEYIPKEIKDLRDKYRVFLDKKEHESKEAKKIKEEILEHESENSLFFQEIKFDLELM